VTYGPGALNLLNPVACAYAEQSPLLVVSGGPEMELRHGEHEVHLHHVVKTYESQLHIFREVTVDAAVLGDPASAPNLIDRVLRNVVSLKRPGYLEIPRDRVLAEVAAPEGRLTIGPGLVLHERQAGALDEAVAEIGGMLASSKNPALYVGAGIRRHGLTAQVISLAERLRLPVTTDVLGKASFPECHPQFAGVYMGAMGDAVAQQLLDGSDCVLGIGVKLTDLGTGFWTGRIKPESRILIDPDGVRVRYHKYDGLAIGQVVQALLDRLPVSDRPVPQCACAPAITPETRTGDTCESAPALKIADIIALLKTVDPSRYGYYGTMGFAVPGALGAGIAEPARRPFALVGDGAFQMTGTELATMVDQRLRPIVLLLNNSGYGMLEAIDRPSPYYNRRNWDFPSFARALGASAERATTFAELETALRNAEAATSAYLIEAVTARDDLSPVMARIRDYAHHKL
jgi:indolepyruvate decarboxylase